MARDLEMLCSDWEHWAATADRSEDGWQSDFPAWNELMESATAAMADSIASQERRRCLELCWAISEEGEELADYAREHVDECMAVLNYLARSPNPSVRWQVYDVLSLGGERAEQLLRDALDDPDPYSRRRAILALTRLRPKDAE